MEARLPRLRLDLEYIPVSYQGRKALLIRDPLDILKEPVLLQGEALELLSLIDGRRNIPEIQVGLTRLRHGIFVPADSIHRLLDELEKAFILESGRLRDIRQRLVQDYAALKIRRASLAGRSYPAERRALEELLDRILAQGSPPGPTVGRVRALVAPHIDLEAGQRAYGRAYGLLRGYPPPQTVLLMGTGHSLSLGYFSLTAKDFETPLGLVKTDRAAVQRLAALAGQAAEADDFGHRAEHSLEFQLLFLQHLFGSGFRLVPILCGSFQDRLAEAGRAADIPAVAPVLDFLREFLTAQGQGVLVVAGVDFFHIGPKFGHDRSAASLLGEAERHDQQLLAALCRRDVSAFWGEVREANDRYNVCGFSTLACLLEVLPADWPPGQVLDYGLRREEATRSAVSFAAIAYSTGI